MSQVPKDCPSRPCSEKNKVSQAHSDFTLSHTARKIKRTNSIRSTPTNEANVSGNHRKPEAWQEDVNNHGCNCNCPPCPPNCAPTCVPQPQIVCCSTSPSVIKILAKLLLFLLLLGGLIYSLYCVASSWMYRHEVLTLLLILLATRLVCRRNWFLPAQYWRNLDPATHPCCEGLPKEVDLSIPAHCSFRD